jgi:hypothetical protein
VLLDGVVLLAGVKTTLIESLSERVRRSAARPAAPGRIVSLRSATVLAVALPLP